MIRLSITEKNMFHIFIKLTDFKFYELSRESILRCRELILSYDGTIIKDTNRSVRNENIAQFISNAAISEDEWIPEDNNITKSR